MSLEVYSRGKALLDFVYEFIIKEGEKDVVAFSYDSTWVFVDAEKRKPIFAPDFFLDALRNLKKD